MILKCLIWFQIFMFRKAQPPKYLQISNQKDEFYRKYQSCHSQYSK